MSALERHLHEQNGGALFLLFVTFLFQISTVSALGAPRPLVWSNESFRWFANISYLRIAHDLKSVWDLQILTNLGRFAGRGRNTIRIVSYFLLAQKLWPG